MRTVPALLRARAASEPDRVALMLDDARRLTYREWDQRSDTVAYRLRRRGLHAGEQVGLVFSASGWLDYAVAYCGVLKASGVAVPLGAHLSAGTVAAMLRQGRVGGVISGPGTAQPDAPGWHVRLPELTDDGIGPLPFAVHVSPSDTAQILYTSSTPQCSKGVATSHASLTNRLDIHARLRPLAHSTYCLHAFALGTEAGQAMLLNTLVAAPTTLIAQAFGPDTFAALIERYRVGSVFLMPSMAAELVNARVHERYDLSSVRLLSSTIAALPSAVALRLAGMLPAATLANCYTSTRTAPAQVTMIFDPSRPDALGRPERADQLEIAGPDGRRVKTGETGLVWLRSAAPDRWRVNDPTADARGLVDRWVTLGDFGYLDADGYLYLVDQAGDLMESGAPALPTQRVEAALYEHPAIAAAAAIGVLHPVLGGVITAAVVTAAGREPVSEGNLRVFLADRLDRHEQPVRIRYLDVPCDTAREVLEERLRELLARGEDGCE